MGAGVHAACELSETRRALSTLWLLGIWPMSKICVQRKLNQPLRITMTCWLVANWRATDSMPKVPLPGTSATEWAPYTLLSMREMSVITPPKRLDMWFRARSV